MRYSLQCISLICWAYFSDILVSTVFRKLLWIRHSADHKTVTMMFFGASLALGSVLGWLCQYHHWVSHRLLHTVHFSSPITIWSRNKSVSLHRIRDDTSKQWFLLFPVNLSSFFTFAICFKSQTTIEWSTLKPSASYVVVGELASLIALSWVLSASDDQPLRTSSSRLLFP